MTSIDAPPRAGRKEWIGLAVLSLPIMLMMFDMFSLLLALPALSADLRPSSVEQLWILDIYGFMVGGFLITMGTLGDRIGRRRVLLIGAAAFGLASVFAAYASSPWMLIVARALLGIAGATLAPSTLSLISNMFRDARQRGVAIGVWASSFTVGAILGPVVGGLMLAHFWWGAVFLLPIPIMVLLLVVGPFLIPEFRVPSAGRLDLVSAGLSLGAMLAFIYGVKELAAHGVRPVPVLAGLAGVGLGVLFVRRQGRLADPMLDLAMFRNRTFSSVLVGLVLYSMVGASSTLFITQHFQSVAGLTAFSSALYMLPGMVVATVSAMGSPLLARRFRPGYVIGLALFGVVATFVWLTQLSPTSSPLVLVVALAVIGLCQGPLISLGTGLVVGAVPVEQSGAASAVSQTANEAGAAVGVALMGSLGTAVYRSMLDSPSVPEAARENVATAVSVASSLPAEVGEALLTAARAAFTQSFAVYAVVAAAFALATALVVLIRIRDVPPTSAGGGH